MPSVSPSQLSELAINTGVRVVGETWPTMPALWRNFTRVVPIGDVSDPPWGHRGTSFATDAAPKRRKDGQEVQAATAGTGFTPQGNIRLIARKIGITQRQMEAENAERVLTTTIAQFQADFLRLCALEVEGHFATMLNKGAFTAGDDVFNGSYDNGLLADPSGNLIYDSKAFFANDHPLALDSSLTRDNYLAGTALDSAGLTAARLKINKTNAVDNLGRQSMQMADLVIVPSDLEYTIDVLLESQNKPGTAQNDRNVFQGRLNKIVHPLLSSATGWFMGVRGQGIVSFDGGTPAFDIDYDKHTKTTWIIGEHRYGGLVDDFRPWVGCNIATS